MNILYLGRYKNRFRQVITNIKDLPAKAQVLELCFGDTYIAEFCRKRGYYWKGIDINNHFVTQAKKLGYDAQRDDLLTTQSLPRATACIIMGSFYHFHLNAPLLLRKMLEASDIVVISEPIFNLSSNRGIIGFLARRTANAGKGNEEFRYNETSLLAMLEENRKSLGFQIASVQRFGKDLVIKLVKN